MAAQVGQQEASNRAPPGAIRSRLGRPVHRGGLPIDDDGGSGPRRRRRRSHPAIEESLDPRRRAQDVAHIAGQLRRLLPVFGRRAADFRTPTRATVLSTEDFR